MHTLHRGSGALAVLVLLGLATACSRAIELPGIVERQVLELTAVEAGRIVALPKSPGERVAAGELLVQLDARVAELQLEAALARRQAAEATLRGLGREFARASDLARERVGTQREVDVARRGNEEAIAIAAERAAQAEEAQRRLTELAVTAPFAGVVDQLPFDVGERVPAGAVAAVLVTEQAPWVRFWLPARLASRAQPGASAQVRVEGLPSALAGRLTYVARQAEFTPHYALTERERDDLVYEARVTLTDAPAELRPGIGATVELALPAGQ